MKQRWKTYVVYTSVIIIGGGLLLILIETVKLKNTGFDTKTLWDWMELLIIPLVLAGGAFYLNRSERNTERELATDRQQEAALQAYLDRMGELLLEKGLRTSENEEVRNVARIRTLTVLRGLDATRKGLVLRFLKEARLIEKENTIVDLNGADLTNANLFGARLGEVNLQHAILDNVNLDAADLTGADLSFAKLNGASLLYTDLSGANLYYVELRGATLRFADLCGYNNVVTEPLNYADLSNVDYLIFANLTLAFLDDADLRDAKASKEQIATAKSLKGATMPDGTIHD